MNKYHSRKAVVDGITFDSGREAERYSQLKLLEKANKITDLALQVKFELLPAQYAESSEVYAKGPKKGQPKRGKCIEKAVFYIADFVYCDEYGRMIVEDAKGMRTKDYIIKRKLFRWKFGEEYEFREV